MVRPADQGKQGRETRRKGKERSWMIRTSAPLPWYSIGTSRTHQASRAARLAALACFRQQDSGSVGTDGQVLMPLWRP